MGLDDWRKVIRWQIAEATGWALEYIDALSFEDIWEFLNVRDGLNKR